MPVIETEKLPRPGGYVIERQVIELPDGTTTERFTVYGPKGPADQPHQFPSLEKAEARVRELRSE
jgi:hypothetical protein